MRYLGQNYSIDVPMVLTPRAGAITPARASCYAHFHAEHRRLYGYDIPDEIIEFVHFKVTAVGPTREIRAYASSQSRAVLRRREARDVYFRQHGGWNDTPVLRTQHPSGRSDACRAGDRRGANGDDASSPGRDARRRRVRQPMLQTSTAGVTMAVQEARRPDRSGHAPGGQQLPRSRRRARWASRCATPRTRRSSTRVSTSRARSSTTKAR